MKAHAEKVVTVMKVLLKASAVLWLAAYMLLATINNMPSNPVKAALLPTLSVTVKKFYPQNWSLFAPNPVKNNQMIIARPLTHAEHEAVLAGAPIPSDGWWDLHMPLWKRFQSMRFSAFDRLSRPQSNALRIYSVGPTFLYPWYDALQEETDPEKRKEMEEFIEKMRTPYRDQARDVITKVASAFVLDAFPEPELYTHIALRVRRTTPVPWSKRFEEEAEFNDYPMEIVEVRHDLKTSGIFRGLVNPDSQKPVGLIENSEQSEGEIETTPSMP